jgi:hypothetical protein
MIKQIVSEVKGELKPAKLVAFLVMLIIAGFILSFLVKKFPQINKVNKIAVS